MSFELFQELEKRVELSKCIDAIIQESYLSNIQRRLKRGAVQMEIINKLGLVRNNLLCTMITERMAHFGYEAIINTSIKYYRHRDYKYTHDVMRVAKNVMHKHSDLFKKLAEND